MKKIIFTYLLVQILSIIGFGQSNVIPEYSFLIRKADSLYKAKNYKNSALTYSAAFKSSGWTGFSKDRYNAACSWSLAGLFDSAFYQLEAIVYKENYANYKLLSTDQDLLTLHNDNRWIIILKRVLENKEKIEANFNKPLIHLLDSLVTEDQKWRNYLTKYENKELGKDTISYNYINRQCVMTDSLNYFFLKVIFMKFGSPNYDLVGKDGSHNFWLLIQHQDLHPQFQDSVLIKMKIEVDKNKANGIDYAYLLDRVKVNTGQLQVYGTQMKLNIDSTSYEPKPVIAPDKINERRKSVGLNSIEEYIEIMNNRFFGSLRKK